MKRRPTLAQDQRRARRNPLPCFGLRPTRYSWNPWTMTGELPPNCDSIARAILSQLTPAENAHYLAGYLKEYE